MFKKLMQALFGPRKPTAEEVRQKHYDEFVARRESRQATSAPRSSVSRPAASSTRRDDSLDPLNPISPVSPMHPMNQASYSQDDSHSRSSCGSSSGWGSSDSSSSYSSSSDSSSSSSSSSSCD